MSEADREIVYRLKPTVDDGAEAEFDKFSTLAEHTAKVVSERLNVGFSNAFKNASDDAKKVTAVNGDKVRANGETNGKAYVNGFTNGVKANGAAIENSIKAHTDRAVKRIRGFAAAAVGTGSEIDQKQVAAALAKIEHLKQMAALKEQVADEKKAAAAEKAAEREIKAAEKAAEREVKAAEKAADKKAAAAEKAAERAYRLEAKWSREAEAAEARRLKQTERDQKKVEADQRRAERAAASANEKQIAATAALNEKIFEGAKGLLQVAKGWAQAAIANGAADEQLWRSLAKIEGIFNQLEGGAIAYKQIAAAVNAYKASVEAAAVAERALAAARALSAGAGGVKNAFTGISGVMGGAAATTAGGAAAVGGAAASALALPAAAAAALASSLLALKVVVEQVSGEGNRGMASSLSASAMESLGVVDAIHGLGKNMSFLNTAANYKIDPYAQEVESDKRLKSNQSSSARFTAEIERKQLTEAELYKADTAFRNQKQELALAGIVDKLRGRGYEGDELEKRAFDPNKRMLEERIKQADATIRAASAPKDQANVDAMIAKGGVSSDDKKAAAMQDRKAALEQILALEGQHYDAVSRTGKAAVDNLNQQLEKNKANLELTKQQLAMVEDSQKDDAERFADATPEKKQFVLKAYAKAVKKKDLNKEEAAALSEYGLARGVARENRARQGERELRQYSTGLGLPEFMEARTRQLTEAQTDVQKAVKLETDISGMIELKIEEVEKEKRGIQDSMAGRRSELLKIVNEEAAKLKKELPGIISQEIERRLRQRLQAGAAK